MKLTYWFFPISRQAVANELSPTEANHKTLLRSCRKLFEKVGFWNYMAVEIWGFWNICLILHQNIANNMSDIRIFKRKIYDRMLQWKQERDGKTAFGLYPIPFQQVVE